MRLFVALPLPVETRAALARWVRSCGTQATLRWTPEEQLHITLHFLGEVADVRAGIVTAALNGVQQRRFHVELDRLVELGRGSILAAAARLTPQLAALEIDIRSRISAFGKKQEPGREFRPHVTLARAQRDAAVPKLKTLPSFLAVKFEATCFRLYRSELRKEGAVHTVVREWMLCRT